MSKRYLLGAQGRAIQQRLEQQPLPPSSFQVAHVVDTQRDVELLLSTLTSGSKADSQQLLSYMVHYLPRVKNGDNVQLLMGAFLQNEWVFDTFEHSYLVIEAFKALFEQKVLISKPSLPLTKFFHGVLSALYSSPVEDWKKSCVLTGITLSKPLFDAHAIPETRGYFEQCYANVTKLNHEIIARGFNASSTNDYTVNSIWAVSLACSMISFNDHMKANLPHNAILMHVIDMVFKSPLGISHGELKQSQSPVCKHLSRLAYVVDNCFIQGVKVPIMDSAIGTILDFSMELHSRFIDNEQCWDFLKLVLFGIVIMLQGYSTFTLHIHNGLKGVQYTKMTSNVLKTLYCLNFIVEKMGSGGFQVYNYVLFTSMDGLFQHGSKQAEILGQWMIYSLDSSLIPQSQYESSKALFAMIYLEHFTKCCREEFYDTVIHPFVKHFIHLPQPLSLHLRHVHRELVESAHSVVLATYSSQKNSSIIAMNATTYLNTVLSQFPVVLSSRQLCLAVETIVRAVAPPSQASQLNRDNLREVLHMLYITIINCPCSTPLKEEGISGGPRTVRQAFINALMTALPFIPLRFLEQWLSNIWELCQGDAYLQDKLWKTISENLDMQRGSVGIQWWYNKDSLAPKL